MSAQCALPFSDKAQFHKRYSKLPLWLQGALPMTGEVHPVTIKAASLPQQISHQVVSLCESSCGCRSAMAATRTQLQEASTLTTTLPN